MHWSPAGALSSQEHWACMVKNCSAAWLPSNLLASCPCCCGCPYAAMAPASCSFANNALLLMRSRAFRLACARAALRQSSSRTAPAAETVLEAVVVLVTAIAPCLQAVSHYAVTLKHQSRYTGAFNASSLQYIIESMQLHDALPVRIMDGHACGHGLLPVSDNFSRAHALLPQGHTR